MMADICESSYDDIPLGGFIRCLCGRYWYDHDRLGNHQISVPFHDRRGCPQNEAKVAARIDLEWIARQRKRKLEAEKEGRRQAITYAIWDQWAAKGEKDETIPYLRGDK